MTRTDVPARITVLSRVALVSLLVCLLVQVGGVWLIVRDVTYALNNIDPANLDMTHFTLLPEGAPRTSLEELLGGMSLSWPAGFWLTVTLAGWRLRDPYRPRAYFWLQAGFAAQLAFLIWSIYTAGQLTPNVWGTLLAVACTVPVAALGQGRLVRVWSQRYRPPAPDVSGLR